MYVQQKVSNQVFVETFTWVHDQAPKVNAILLNFQIIVDSLMKFEASTPDEHFNVSEARLEYFVDVLLRLVTGAGPRVARDSH